MPTDGEEKDPKHAGGSEKEDDDDALFRKIVDELVPGSPSMDDMIWMSTVFDGHGGVHGRIANYIPAHRISTSPSFFAAAMMWMARSLYDMASAACRGTGEPVPLPHKMCAHVLVTMRTWADMRKVAGSACMRYAMKASIEQGRRDAVARCERKRHEAGRHDSLAQAMWRFTEEVIERGLWTWHAEPIPHAICAAVDMMSPKTETLVPDGGVRFGLQTPGENPVKKVETPRPDPGAGRDEFIRRAIEGGFADADGDAYMRHSMEIHLHVWNTDLMGILQRHLKLEDPQRIRFDPCEFDVDAEGDIVKTLREALDVNWGEDVQPST